MTGSLSDPQIAALRALRANPTGLRSSNRNTTTTIARRTAEALLLAGFVEIRVHDRLDPIYGITDLGRSALRNIWP